MEECNLRLCAILMKYAVRAFIKMKHGPCKVMQGLWAHGMDEWAHAESEGIIEG